MMVMQASYFRSCTFSILESKCNKMNGKAMKPLWEPSKKQMDAANISRFMGDLGLLTYGDLYAWSLKNPVPFWRAVWQFTSIQGTLDEATILVPDPVFRKNQFFRDSTLNYAENLLRVRNDTPAVIFWGEDQVHRTLTFNQLATAVAQVAASLKKMGVEKGDRVAAYISNMPEALIAMLATVSLGAIWSSCSPDFGSQGVLDRFSQIEPKVLFTTNGYYFKGKVIDIRSKVQDVVANLPTLKQVVMCSYVDLDCGDWASFEDFKDPSVTHQDLQFCPVAFNHPLFIMFSSGTTGKPKCIVHGHGGTLIQHLKEHQLHCDIKPGDRVFYYTTTGWMMWNWLVTALASEATLVLFDGSPFAPTPSILFDMAQKEGVSFFGTSAKYLDAINKEALEPYATHDLSQLRTIGSTGSPLMPESFDYVYEKVAPHANLASLSGGTDIISCFALGCPILPVWRGELQTRGLGMAVDTFDDTGKPIRGQKGELVCTQPFPSMPVSFWKDPQGEKYHTAYFSRFDNVWCHGDYVEITDHEGLIFYGRSDALLNPGGIRIGTAEIYRQVEQVSEVLESIAIGQEWQGDVRVILFVKLRAGTILTSDLKDQINLKIRANTTPHHVPALILEVPDIPRTISGKIVELAVTEAIHGRPVKNQEALANPEALAYFKERQELMG
jgi:acetoacetyl-CoA synthetase